MYTLISRIVALLKKIIPEPVVALFRGPYHLALTILMTVWYGFPARKLTVLGITGTKGKSTVADMLYAILTHSGHKTALLSTIHFVTPESEEANMFKMTMQGRGFTQALLARAVKEGATYAVVEVTSEGVLQNRHRLLSLDGLIVTTIHKEHIERHGSFENYVAAKRAIVRELEHSSKKRRVLVSNADNEYTSAFLDDVRDVEPIPFSESDLNGIDIELPIPGAFNTQNALAAVKLAEAFGIARKDALEALKNMPPIRGRVEKIDEGQNFDVYVDYAHTPESLEALYGTFKTSNKICVLGNTGGGRDTWKRPLMGAIADQHCNHVILTNEDPYDEDPEQIVRDMTPDMKREPQIIMDRREAIHAAFTKAAPGDVVLISGKGTDPYIMESKGEKTPWSDAKVAREELARLQAK